MTVQELIILLLKCPLDAKVKVASNFSGWIYIDGIDGDLSTDEWVALR